MTSPTIGIDYSSKLPKTNKARRWLIRLCVIGALVLAAMSLLLPNLCRSRETANRVACASNLRQIGQAILLYANDLQQTYRRWTSAIVRGFRLRKKPEIFIWISTLELCGIKNESAFLQTFASFMSSFFSAGFDGFGVRSSELSFAGRQYQLETEPTSPHPPLPFKMQGLAR